MSQSINADGPSLDVLYQVTRADVEAMAGRAITDDEAARISKAIGFSTAGDAIGEVVFSVAGSADENECLHGEFTCIPDECNCTCDNC